MPADPLEYLFSLEQFGIKFGLDNIRALVARLGHPEHAFASVHVAGTNGKGSVTAMVDSAIRAAGFRTGRYTSPHLVHLTERFTVDGQPVGEDRLRAVVGRVREAATALQRDGQLQSPPTFFEVTTAAAFDLFRESGVDMAVCEVGLGGRLDATNVLSPVVSSITSIAFDHQQYLGSTLAQIAHEKAGIIKRGVPVVVGALEPAIAGAISTVADQEGARFIQSHEGVVADPLTPDAFGPQTLRLRTPVKDYGTVELALAGRHQIENAITAVRILETLDERGWTIPSDAIARGLASVRWPGRLETIRVDARRRVLLDAAHNPAGAVALARFLAGSDKRPLVLATMKDKDAAGILQALAPTVSALVVTRASHPRAADPHELAALASSVAPALPVAIEPSPEAALERAWAWGPDIVVAGSIFLLGDIKKALGLS